LRLPRFYPILDTGLLTKLGADPVAAAGVLLEAGAGILQFRHKGHYSRDVFAQAQTIASLCRDAGAQFIVNDRSDIAAMLGAGVHLGQDDLPPAEVRRVFPTLGSVGFSTHNEAQFRAAANEPVDAVALGPIFGTASKENPDPVVGLDELRRVAALKRHPLIAIGGITLDSAAAVWGAGADSIAVIGALFADGASTSSLRSRTEQWLWYSRQD